VAIYDEQNNTIFDKGDVTLTTHRLIWMDPLHKSKPIAILLGQVIDVDNSDHGGFKMKASPKITMRMVNRKVYRLSFKSTGRDPFLAKFKQAIKEKAWEIKKIEPLLKKKEAFDPSKAGITGIMREVDNRAKETDSSLKEAFTDLAALMDKVKDMVAFAEKFAQHQAKEESKEEETEMRSMLISMGIASPVTKETAGSLYHTQLSRQLADWLQKPLQVYGGMIALTDLYCTFNRARGTELISPDDLYRACFLFEELSLPVRLRKFETGVLVVQSMGQTDDVIAKQMEDLLRRDGPQTAFDVAKTKNISIALASEQLLTAEKQGVLCRDETYEGLTFYLNFFQNQEWLKLYQTNVL